MRSWQEIEAEVKEAEAAFKAKIAELNSLRRHCKHDWKKITSMMPYVTQERDLFSGFTIRVEHPGIYKEEITYVCQLCGQKNEIDQQRRAVPGHGSRCGADLE